MRFPAAALWRPPVCAPRCAPSAAAKLGCARESGKAETRASAYRRARSPAGRCRRRRAPRPRLGRTRSGRRRGAWAAARSGSARGAGRRRLPRRAPVPITWATPRAPGTAAGRRTHARPPRAPRPGLRSPSPQPSPAGGAGAPNSPGWDAGGKLSGVAARTLAPGSGGERRPNPGAAGTARRMPPRVGARAGDRADPPRPAASEVSALTPPLLGREASGFPRRARGSVPPSHAPRPGTLKGAARHCPGSTLVCLASPGH